MRKMTLLAGVLGLLLVLGMVAPVYAADTVTVKGEVIDTYCYGMAGAKGESHRACGLSCAKAGIPVGLLEDGSGKVYVLLPTKDATPVPQAAIDKMGRKATITGKVIEKGGSRFLTVESVK